MSKIIGLVVLVLVVGAIAWFASPKFRGMVKDQYNNLTEWDAEARRKDPSGFLEYSMKKLDENIGKFEDARSDLERAKRDLDKNRGEHRAKVDFSDAQLAEFKKTYQAAKASGTWPVSVAGKQYNEAQLKSQVELTLSERNGYEGLLKQFDAALVKAESKHLEIVNRVNESKAKRNMLEAQKSLLEADMLTAETEKLMADVHEVLVDNESVNVVRTVDDLMKDAKASVALPTTPNADTFLNS